MKKTALVVLLFLGFINCFGQKKNDPLNFYFNKIVQIQIMNNLDINVPVVYVGQGLFFYGNYNKSNGKAYFNENIQSKPIYKSSREFVENEFVDIFNNRFIKTPQLDSALIIKAFSNTKHLFDLKYNIDGDKQSLSFDLPKKGFSKEIIFEDGILVSSIIEKSGHHYFNNFGFYQDTLIINTKYDTKKRKYLVTKEILRNNRIESKIHYKPDNDKDARKIKTIEKFEYSKSGQIVKIKSSKRNGIAVDSILYFYKDNLLTSKAWKSKTDYVFTNYQYNENSLVKEKSIIVKDNKFKVLYNYNDENKILDISINDDNNKTNKKFEFVYNIQGELITMLIYSIGSGEVQAGLVRHYDFAYNDQGMIEVLREVGSEGNITKEISYEIEYLDNQVK